MLECFEVVVAYVDRKLPCVFIFNENTCFFPSNVYLRGSMNRNISYIWWWDGWGWGSFVHVFLHQAALCSFVFFFYSLPTIKTNTRLSSPRGMGQSRPISSHPMGQGWVRMKVWVGAWDKHTVMRFDLSQVSLQMFLELASTQMIRKS
jgi:hypothetical protein